MYNRTCIPCIKNMQPCTNHVPANVIAAYVHALHMSEVCMLPLLIKTFGYTYIMPCTTCTCTTCTCTFP